MAFVLLSKTPHIVQSRVLMSGLDGSRIETPVISEFFFWWGVGVKQIIDSLSFLFLLTLIRLKFYF